MYGFSRTLFRQIPLTHVPVGILSSNGSFESRRLSDWVNEPIRICPEILEKELETAVRASDSGSKYEGYLNGCSGGEAVIRDMHDYQTFAFKMRWTSPNPYFAKLSFGAAFLQSPNPALPPLVQEILEARDSNLNRSMKSIARQAISEPQSLTPHEIDFLLNEFSFVRRRMATFPKYDPVPFSVGDQLFNLAHPLVELALRSIAWLLLSNKKDATYGRLSEAINQLFEVYLGSTRNALSSAASAMIAYRS